MRPLPLPLPTVDEVEAVVKMLVGCGVDLEARTSDGETCTHVAAVAGNEAALRCFINIGGDLNSANLDERTPLHLVSNYKCTVLLLAAGADLNKRDSVHRTAFQWAVSWRRTASLPAFLAAGADRSDVPKQRIAAVSDHQVDSARRDIAKVRLDCVRHRAVQVCIGLGLQSLGLDALQMCEILHLQLSFRAFGRVSSMVEDCDHCETLSKPIV
jgi:hypothetical protein